MIVYKIIRPILYLFMKVRYNPLVINGDVLPKEGKVILAGNHTNNYDFMTLGMGTKRCIRYVAKDELCKGIKKYFFKMVGIVPVNRRIHDKSVIPTCVNLLNDGNVVGIFPEGTINKSSDYILPFKVGAVVMAIKSNSMIIPFAINGKYERGKLKIVFGEGYYPSDDVDKEVKILEDKVVNLIKGMED